MNKHRYKALVLLLIVVVLGTVVPTSQVEAGAQTHTMDASTFKNEGDWNNLKGDVKVDGTKIIFPVDSTARTGFICKSVIRGDEFFPLLASVECDLKLTKLPAGKSFVLSFGLPGIESNLGDRGNVEVTFTNNSGIKVGVVAYEKKGNPITVCSPKSVGMSLNTSAKVKAEITTEGKIQVSINGKTVCTGDLPVSGQGRVGFLQTGNCGAEIDGFKMTYYQYYRPENTNIQEDFKEGSMNISVLMGKTLSGFRTMSFENYNGNEVLMFKSVGETYLGTYYSYSNFEMTFDVPYLKFNSSLSEEGEALEGTGKIGVSFGSTKTNASSKGYESAIDMITFEKGTVYSFKKAEEYVAENPYWSEDKPFSLQIIVKDCTVTVGAKWMNETSYQQLLSYSLRNQDVTGYVHFWVADYANMAIDNLKITNLDHNAKVVEKEFVSGKIEKPADWVYEPFPRVYATETDIKEDESTFPWYLLIPTTALVGVVVLVTIDLVIGKSRKKQKESDNK